MVNIDNIIKESIDEELYNARNSVNTNPTEKQKSAGNYKKGHVKINGFKISIENPKGSVRRGKTKNGKEWSVQMPHDYGYFVTTKGKDGDAIDVFIGDALESEKIYVVDQKLHGKFDESKVMFCFDTIEDAKQGYMNSYEEGWNGFWKITPVSLSVFKKWLYDGKKQRKPFYDYVEIIKANKKEKMNEERLDQIIKESIDELSFGDIKNFGKKYGRKAMNAVNDMFTDNDDIDSYYERMDRRRRLANTGRNIANSANDRVNDFIDNVPNYKERLKGFGNRIGNAVGNALNKYGEKAYNGLSNFTDKVDNYMYDWNERSNRREMAKDRLKRMRDARKARQNEPQTIPQEPIVPQSEPTPMENPVAPAKKPNSAEKHNALKNLNYEVKALLRAGYFGRAKGKIYGATEKFIDLLNSKTYIPSYSRRSFRSGSFSKPSPAQVSTIRLRESIDEYSKEFFNQYGGDAIMNTIDDILNKVKGYANMGYFEEEEMKIVSNFYRACSYVKRQVKGDATYERNRMSMVAENKLASIIRESIIRELTK